MNLTESATLAVVSLGWLALMFIPLERSFPAWPGQRLERKGWLNDIGFFLGQYLAFAGLAAAILTWAYAPLTGWAPLAWVRGVFAELPLVARVLLALVLGDVCAYWGHRAQHSFEWLWRFHSVHHTTLELDWLAAHREHPLDGLYTQAMVNAPALLLGLDIGSVMGLVVFRGTWAIFIHSNVRVPLGPLRYLVGAPELPHWHHARSRDVGNYANLAPYLDVLFGTYHCPPHEPDDLGVEDTWTPASYVGLVCAPLMPRRWAMKVFKAQEEGGRG